MDWPSPDGFAAVQDAVYAALPPTPQYAWPLLREALGCEVWVKHENHTPLGAFKVRGGLVYLQRLRERQPGLRDGARPDRRGHAHRRCGLHAGAGVPRVVARRRLGGSAGDDATGRRYGLSHARTRGVGADPARGGRHRLGERRRSGRRNAPALLSNAAEGAGAAALAAAMQQCERWHGRCVGVALSGGNVDRALFAKVLSEA